MKNLLNVVIFMQICVCTIVAQPHNEHNYHADINVVKMSQDEFSKLLNYELNLINKNDMVQITSLYNNIRYKPDNDYLYIDRVQQILWMIQPSFETKSSVRKEVIRLAESVVDVDIKQPTYGTLKKQLRTFEYVLARYEFQYREEKHSSSLQKTSDTALRKKRIDQFLMIWHKLISYIDDTWNPELMPMTSMDVKLLYAIISINAQAEAEFETKNIKNDAEREKTLLEVRNRNVEKYMEEAKEKSKPFYVYQEQKMLHELKNELEPGVIDLVASLYAIKPYNTEELSEILKKYKMSEDFTQAVFDKLEKTRGK